MATIKQLKIGSTNYDIKALNASNQNQASAVVRDIQYGTSAPSGGSAGQMYLQYNTDTTVNNYIYAEDNIGSSSANVIDNYYSKNEVNNLFTILTDYDNISLDRIDYAANASMKGFSFVQNTGRFSLDNTNARITCLEAGTYLIVTNINAQSKMSSNLRIYSHMGIPSGVLARYIGYGQFCSIRIF